MPRNEIAAVDLDIKVSVRTVDGSQVLHYSLSSPSGAAARVTPGEAQTEPFKGSFDAYRDRVVQRLQQLQHRIHPHGAQLRKHEVELEFEKLGHELYRQLFPAEMKWMYRQWRETVRTIQISSAEWWVPWELIRPYDHDLQPVVDDDFLGARYEITRWLPGGTAPAAEIRILRMACVEAGSTGHPRLPSAVRERELLESLARSRKIEDASPKRATFAELMNLLVRGGLDLLHFVGHGEFSPEDAEASRIVLADARTLSAGELDGPLLRQVSKDRPLIYFNACSTAQQGATLTSLSGWPDAWIGRGGAGAFIAPQWPVRDSLAFEFARVFYQALERGRRLGRAVRLARWWVRRKDRRHATWLAFAAYGNPNAAVALGPARVMGRRPAQRVEITSAADAPPSLPPPLLFPTDAPYAPDIFVGRTRDLDRLKERLGIGKDRAQDAEIQVLTAIRGWPGVGKTSVAAALAHDSDLGYRFEGVLWASIGQEPKLLAEMIEWGRLLKSDELYRASSLKEASSLLRGLLRERCLLLFLDDVWDAAHAAVFQEIAGPGCGLVATTRETGVAQMLAVREESVYPLDVLDADSAFDLLHRLAAEVVDLHPAESRRLVQELECHPLALQVAGRLLREDAAYGLSVEDLLRDLGSGRAILNALAPRDRFEVSDPTLPPTLPTVSALLQRSTDRLDAETRERFRLLSVFAVKPATFGLAALRRVWEVEDPVPTVRELVRRGLLEPEREGRFRLHSLLQRHAEMMLPAA